MLSVRLQIEIAVLMVCAAISRVVTTVIAGYAAVSYGELGSQLKMSL
jgi:hypothetical protein